MKVGYLQTSPVFGDKQTNFEQVETLIDNNKADLIVLPELSFSGYAFTSREETASLAETVPDGFTMKRMRELSTRFDCGIIYGFPEIDEGNLYNSCAFVSPESEIEVYRKLHLYYYYK